jgi:hypothetical protein
MDSLIQRGWGRALFVGPKMGLSLVALSVQTQPGTISEVAPGKILALELNESFVESILVLMLSQV